MEIVPVQEGVKLYQTSKDEKGAVDVADTVVPDTAAAPTLKTFAFAHKSFTGAGAIILNAFEVAEVNPGEVKVMVALATAAALVAVKLVYVAVPLTAESPKVPPIVQVPEPTDAVTIAVLAVVLPYWS